MTETNWKYQLLKSSLPIEHIVSSMLSELNFYSWGEFAYNRIDEQGNEKEFTVDLNCFYELAPEDNHAGLLNLLIECKYSSEEIKWIFLPQPIKSEVAGSCIGFHDGLTGKFLSDKRQIYNFDSSFSDCIRGIALKNGSFDPTPISKATNQLRYTLPNLLANNLEDLLSASHSEDLNILFYAGIVVTNAPLYVLKRGLNIEDFKSANDLAQVADLVNAVKIIRDSTPLNNHQSKYLSRMITKDNQIYRKRLEAFSTIVNKNYNLWDWFPSQYAIEGQLAEAGDSIVIITIDHLNEFATSLLNTLKTVLGNVEQLFYIKPKNDLRNEEIISVV